MTTPVDAKKAESADACAVMALERVPLVIQKYGGADRMSDPEMVKAIKASVSIPVMVRARDGNVEEAQVSFIFEVL